MDFPTTIIVDEVPPMPSDAVVHIDAEIVRIPFDGKGVEVWNGKKYIRRRANIVQQEGNVFLLTVVPPNTAWSRLIEGWAKFARRVISFFKRDFPA